MHKIVTETEHGTTKEHFTLYTDEVSRIFDENPDRVLESMFVKTTGESILNHMMNMERGEVTYFRDEKQRFVYACIEHCEDGSFSITVPSCVAVSVEIKDIDCQGTFMNIKSGDLVVLIDVGEWEVSE